MIKNFYDKDTERIYDRKPVKSVHPNLQRAAQRKLDMLDAAVTLEDLRIPPRNYLEKLSRDRVGQHSIRVNDQFRICFIWTGTGPERVEFTDYH